MGKERDEILDSDRMTQETKGNSRFILCVSKEVCGRESSFVKYSEEVFILREVFGGGVHPS
ncbi:hypothetical protein LR48_Vigan03g109300 [Vigna angularis]|uniref:Uncharacterized protein n=1 Tax=Phaseolus angularis TaxID=3914 RepID=A0A0L9U4K7_PHAAN|nr:hypothetical protein LR48_Vigan03g109300 [Vigna angularis]